jgi:hypothetical protein
MTAQRNRRWKLVVLMGMLFVVTVACSAKQVMCFMRGGDWQYKGQRTELTSSGEEKKVSVYGCVEGKQFDYLAGPVVNSDGDDVAAAPPPEPDLAAEPAQESAPQPEANADEAPSPADEAPPAPASIASCIPQPGEYKIEIVDVNDRTSSSGEKRVCNAEGMLTNTGSNELMFAAYRVQNYGGHNYEKWASAGYQTLYPGDKEEFAEFYRCTGTHCGEGEWYYFDKVSILYKTPECLELAFSQEDKIPESITPVENPCDW